MFSYLKKTFIFELMLRRNQIHCFVLKLILFLLQDINNHL
jgi:hypothetical protein